MMTNRARVDPHADRDGDDDHLDNGVHASARGQPN